VKKRRERSTFIGGTRINNLDTVKAPASTHRRKFGFDWRKIFRFLSRRGSRFSFQLSLDASSFRDLFSKFIFLLLLLFFIVMIMQNNKNLPFLYVLRGSLSPSPFSGGSRNHHNATQRGNV
jgi:hypothetical protein